MDPRDHPRMPPTEGRARDPVTEGPPPRRFPRLAPPPAVRHHPPQRLALGAVVATAGALLVAWGLAHALGGMVAWLHAQPSYQVAFRDITLDPPPGPWYRGGRAAFLDRVQAGSRQPRAFSVLDLDPQALFKAFQLDPWVYQVRRVRKEGPRTVVVSLRYREPVAVALWGPGEFGPAVDAEGVLLPRDEIDLEALSPRVYLWKFDRPANPRYGLKWDRLDPRQGLARPDPRVAAAARLAATLHALARAEPSASPALNDLYILYDETQSGEPLHFVQAGHDVFLWIDPASPGKPPLSDEEKWARLVDQVRRARGASFPGWIYYRLTRDGPREYRRRLPEDPPGGNGVDRGPANPG